MAGKGGLTLSTFSSFALLGTQGVIAELYLNEARNLSFAFSQKDGAIVDITGWSFSTPIRTSKTVATLNANVAIGATTVVINNAPANLLNGSQIVFGATDPNVYTLSNLTVTGATTTSFTVSPAIVSALTAPQVVWFAKPPISWVDFTAELTYNSANILENADNFVLSSASPQTDSGLVITNVNPVAGTATFSIPPTVLSMPANLATYDSIKTLFKLIDIVATIPSVSNPLNPSVYVLPIGIIIRLG